MFQETRNQFSQRGEYNTTQKFHHDTELVTTSILKTKKNTNFRMIRYYMPCCLENLRYLVISQKHLRRKPLQKTILCVPKIS